MSSNTSQRIRQAFSDIPGMHQQQPDESPPRNLRGPRAGSMPLAAHPQPDHLHTQQQSQSVAYVPRRSSPGPLTSSQPQHVLSPNSQNFTAGHPPFHSHPDQGPELSQVHVNSQPSPPLNFPRPVQRVPPPLLGPDPRFNPIRADWTMSGQLLAELSRTAQEPEATTPMSLAGINTGSSQHGAVPNPKGPIIENIERDRVREKKDSPRDSEIGGAATGSAGSVIGRSGSLRQSLASSQTQAQPKTETPPRTPPHAPTSHGQAQRPLNAASEPSPPSTSRPTDRDQGSPTYYPPLTGHHTDAAHYAQPQPQTQSRDNSPPFRYNERQQIGTLPSKTKTPDRSLPVQEENEAEEDVTITPAVERERARERERQRDPDLENVKDRPRPLNHRLPTPQFSSSPMIPPERIKSDETPSEVDLSTTIQGDDYDDTHAVYDNKHTESGSRAGHRLDTEEARHQDTDDTRRHIERGAIQQEAEDQEETESYTPRSHHASLPQVPIGNSGGPSLERVVYNTSQLHFRPRTASSDAGGMVSLDAAVLHDAIEMLQHPSMPEQGHSYPGIRGAQRQQDIVGPGSPYSSAPLLSQHTLPHLVATPEDIRGIVNDPRSYEAWQRHMSSAHIRPGAPVPPTPPNPAAASLSYVPPPFSPPPPRSTPYPYSFPYQHLVHRSPQDPQHILQQMQQQQLHQLQLLAANGMQSDSTFSPSSTPYPSYDYSPFLAEHFRRANGLDEASMSMRSSPSHMPVNLPIFNPSRRLQAKRQSLRRVRGSRELVYMFPPRGESTEPRETSPESSDGEEGDQVEYEACHEPAAQPGSMGVGTSSGSASTGQRVSASVEDEGEWVDEDDDAEDDLLHLEYHPNFVVNPDKRKKRWESKWVALIKAFQALDRQTDSTLLLLAAPTHTNSLYSIRSRSLRRISSLIKAPELEEIRSSFRALAVQRRLSRAQTRHMSLAERFEQYTSSPSSEGSEGREEELKGALGAALSSLSALSSIYEGREQRWRTEMGRVGEEQERVEVLLRQALGMGFGQGIL